MRKTLHRRGLRNRPWIVEWDESATELLLDKGFSPTMGARPLMRAMAQFFLLEQAYPEITSGKACDALLVINSSPGDLEFATRLCEMYQAWSGHRGMKLEPIPGAHFWAARVNGFGALTLLQNEHGTHHWTEGKKGNRHSCFVSVTSIDPADKSPNLPAEPDSPITTRRYQQVPTPLVIDKIRPFRTGRLDLVMKGHFDLINR